jgi:hypothetical protein
MKIVINRCYGGFGLSLEAKEKYCHKKGKQLFFYKQTAYNFKEGYDEYTKLSSEEEGAYSYAWLVDMGEVSRETPQNNDDWFSESNIDRTDHDLIDVIEEMGERANGFAAKLEIVEIPENVNWEIEEYDGKEWVSEAHRTW